MLFGKTVCISPSSTWDKPKTWPSSCLTRVGRWTELRVESKENWSFPLKTMSVEINLSPTYLYSVLACWSKVPPDIAHSCEDSNWTLLYVLFSIANSKTTKPSSWFHSFVAWSKASKKICGKLGSRWSFTGKFPHERAWHWKETRYPLLKALWSWHVLEMLEVVRSLKTSPQLMIIKQVSVRQIRNKNFCFNFTFQLSACFSLRYYLVSLQKPCHFIFVVVIHAKAGT